MNHITRGVVLALLAASVTGCASYKHRNQMEAFNTSYVAGDYAAAAKAMAPSSLMPGKPGEDETVLELLHQAEAYRLAGEPQTAIDLYDQAEAGMKLNDTDNLAEKGAENALAVLVNDAQRDYQPMLSEAVLVNTYKGLAFLQMGNGANARVEFNRADDRTRRAVAAFAEEIDEQKAALDEQAAEDANREQQAIQESLDSKALHESVAQQYGAPSQWSVYPEFIVPSATYLHGLYFLASDESGDIERAATSLSRVAAMAPGSEPLAADAALANAIASGEASRERLKNRVWVVYENGLGPVAEEKRLDVPLILFHGNTQAPAYTGIALPAYADRHAVGDALSLVDTQGQRYEPETFASMGKVVHTEMQSRFPAILGRSVASAVVKALMQNEATERLGVAGQLGSAVVTAMTTQADLRSWQATPDHWEVARFARPASGAMTLETPSGSLGDLDLPDWPYTLVYIKRPSAQGPADVSVIDLQGEHAGTQYRMDGTKTTRLVADTTDI
ncbi:hypothetical protein [Chromohalobacter sp. 48-RD10]|uniref:COG3014 family protein n=1 Tax=Chromohalobacter sp. 48-RD10 TaxID=2994063 RepID=UPI002469425E|nr:hypothetical protein [Chromohalobacter sp. 48-RD10]